MSRFTPDTTPASPPALVGALAIVLALLSAGGVTGRSGIRCITPALMILGTLPFAIGGAIFFLYLLGHIDGRGGIGSIRRAGGGGSFGAQAKGFL